MIPLSLEVLRPDRCGQDRFGYSCVDMFFERVRVHDYLVESGVAPGVSGVPLIARFLTNTAQDRCSRSTNQQQLKTTNILPVNYMFHSLLIVIWESVVFKDHLDGRPLWESHLGRFRPICICMWHRFWPIFFTILHNFSENAHHSWRPVGSFCASFFFSIFCPPSPFFSSFCLFACLSERASAANWSEAAAWSTEDHFGGIICSSSVAG